MASRVLGVLTVFIGRLAGVARRFGWVCALILTTCEKNSASQQSSDDATVEGSAIAPDGEAGADDDASADSSTAGGVEWLDNLKHWQALPDADNCAVYRADQPKTQSVVIQVQHL